MTETVQIKKDVREAPPAIPEPSPSRYHPGPKSKAVIAGVVGVIVVAGLWEGYARFGSSTFIPPLTNTVSRVGELLGEGTLWTSLGFTVRAWAAGLAASILVAVPLGVIIGSSRLMQNASFLPVEIMRTVPPVIILPLVLLLLGNGLEFQILLIMQGAVWPVLIQTSYGVRTVHPVLIDTAKSFRLGKLRQMLLFSLPAAMPAVATSVKLAAAFCFSIAIVTEIIGGSFGLGALMLRSEISGDNETLFAVTLIVGIVGLVIVGLFSKVEAYFTTWKQGG